MIQVMSGWATRVPAWLLARITSVSNGVPASTPAIRTNSGSSFGSFPTANPAVRLDDPKAISAFYTSGI